MGMIAPWKSPKDTPGHNCRSLVDIPPKKKQWMPSAVSQVCGRERWHPRWKHGALPGSSGSRVIRRMALKNHGKMMRK